MRHPIVPRDRSLASYLAALMGILAVPLLALTVIPTSIYVVAERGRLESVARAAREDVLSSVDRDLSAKLAILRALATSPALDAGDFGRFDSQARELIGTEDFNIILRDAAGRQIANTIVPKGFALPETPNPTATAVEAKQSFISNLLGGPSSEELLTVASVPVLRAGEVRYILSAVLTSAYFTKLLTHASPAAPYYATVADRGGLIIASSHRSDAFVGKVLPGFDDITLSEGSWTGLNPLGIPVLRIHRRSSLSGWIVAISVPQAALLAPLHRSLALVFALGAAVALVAVGCGVFLCRKMTRVFRSLSFAAQHIGDGGIVALPRSSLREANEIGRALEQASRKLTEDADTLKRVNEDLERRVEERTRMLRAAKDIAESARARAEAASQAKSQFLASMSHELRTPLSAMSGFAQLLHNAGGTLLRERQIRYAKNIMDAGEHLLSIVDDVLDLARIESGRIGLSCEPLDCLEIMSEVYRTLEPLAKARGVMFTVDTSANLPLVLADRGRLKQVLLNLGSNALKYNIEDGWALLVASPGDDGMVRFLMQDTGPGIPPERCAEIFTPFNRLGAELGAEEGTGIGLAISRELVHAMQGEIGFESVVGMGSSFWIDIPIAQEPAATAIRLPADPPVAAMGRSRVLYIEDKILNVDLMRGIIENTSSLQFLEAQTVHDGLALARSLRPDVIITDIHLPDGKGFDVLQHLREDDETAHIPIIALTADAMPINMHNMARAGFDHIVTKPFKVVEFVDMLRSTLRTAAWPPGEEARGAAPS